MNCGNGTIRQKEKALLPSKRKRSVIPLLSAVRSSAMAKCLATCGLPKNYVLTGPGFVNLARSSKDPLSGNEDISAFLLTPDPPSIVASGY